MMPDLRLEVRSEEVQEVMSHVPHWIVRSGISIIFITTATLFLLAWMIRYPEIVVSRITVMTANPPARVIAPSSGRLTTIFVQENGFVKANAQIAAIENSANVQDVDILKAPIDGTISFFRFWSPNQFVNAGDEVATVLPSTEGLIGRLYIPQAASGKVRAGQKVNIKFDGYPFREFGIVTGRIESVSAMARENQYPAIVSLPNGLKSSYNKQLEFKQEMQGSAEIITEDLSVLQRILHFRIATM